MEIKTRRAASLAPRVPWPRTSAATLAVATAFACLGLVYRRVYLGAQAALVYLIEYPLKIYRQTVSAYRALAG